MVWEEPCVLWWQLWILQGRTSKQWESLTTNSKWKRILSNKKCKIKTKQWNTRKLWELLSMSVEVEIRTMNLQEKCENFTSCFLILVRQLFWKEYFQPQLFWLDRQGIVAGLWETEILRMCIWKSDSRREQSINHHIDFLRLL